MAPAEQFDAIVIGSGQGGNPLAKALAKAAGKPPSSSASIRARAQGRNVRVAKMPASGIARGLETDETRGMLKIVVDAETEQILGAAMLAVEGGEMASMLQIAMMGKLPYTALRGAIWSHPTWSEALNNVFFQLED